MSRPLEFPCRITNGRIPEATAKQIAVAVRALDGKQVVLSLREAKRTRSGNQNRYLWGVVVAAITQAFREAGNNVDAEDVYAFLKDHVWKLKQVIVTPDGEVLRGPGSTRNKTTMEMEDLLEQARAWAAEVLGIEIPLPNEHVSSTTHPGEPTE